MPQNISNLKPLFFLLAIMVSTLSCSKKNEDLVPNTYVDITLYLGNPSNIKLNSIGGWVYVNGGVKGIVVYKRSPEEFVAFDRNCTYKPSNSCSTIDVDASGITAIDSCCGSKFQIYDGSVVKGPATRPLRQYSTSLNGSALHIYNY